MTGRNLAVTAYKYGQFYEKRKRTPATNEHYRTYEATMMNSWRELVEYGATDANGKLIPILKEAMNAGRDSVGYRD